MTNKLTLIGGLLCLFSYTGFAQNNTTVRARNLDIAFDGVPGKNNAITDVANLEVGYKTLIEGTGNLVPGKGPVRTGVTVILPKGKTDKTYAASSFSLNGDGEMTGLPFIEDFGIGYGPIGITNTNSVGIVRDAIGQWCFNKFSKKDFVDFSFGLPVVAETWDGVLNDINGFHISKEHVWDALNSAAPGPVREGNVGGGTGMVCYEFKGGSGTSSRIFTIDSVNYTLGVFVQANFGRRSELMIQGIPLGKAIPELEPVVHEQKRKDGSIIVIVATDAPLLPGQLKLVAKRVTHGIARTGTFSHNGSGEIFLALSTAVPVYNNSAKESWDVIPKGKLDKIFEATVQATEEAIINALVAASDMEGINGNKVFALPHQRLMEIINRPRAIQQ
ncbi:DmpA family aminopeptidase [Flavihumibacter petaseus]|uniref:Putative D-aminopeptidase n=1 Tax=Flavihumibacter petaseus NBRC 106054 TaxID=1220578 RepID=A0A0E9MW92_9BACT|nr:P1 family peptidase [Flavihumibacter petaseus]GAO41370.1 putative D-aminopeptidase [Flavihumibacter petaseus NBRC 106054]